MVELLSRSNGSSSSPPSRAGRPGGVGYAAEQASKAAASAGRGKHKSQAGGQAREGRKKEKGQLKK